jgi:signal transduction histidine kinase
MASIGLLLHTAEVIGDRRPVWVLAGTALIAAAATALTLTLGERNVADDAFAGPAWILGSAVVAAVVLRHQPGHGAGLVLQAGAALFAVDLLAERWAYQAVVVDPGSLPAAAAAAWVSMVTAPAAAGLLLAGPLLLFPDGVTRTRWLRRYVRVAVVVSATALVVAAAVGFGAPARDLIDHPHIESSGRGAVAVGISFIAFAFFQLSVLVGLFNLVVGAATARGERRRQYTTVLAGAAVVVASFPVVQVLHLPEWAQTLAVLVLPVSLGVAIVRYRLYDIDVIVARVVVSAAVALACLGVYLGAAAVTGRATGGDTTLDGPALVAALAVVAVLAPLARLAQRALHRWLYGARSDAAGLSARLGEQVAVARGPGAGMLEELVQTVAGELRLGGLAVEVGGTTTASVGDMTATTEVELVHRGEHLGMLRAAPRRNERFTAAELGVLRDTAGVMSVALGAIQLADDLAAARGREVAAHLAERRRLRMDLHDGLGPTLASIRMRLAAGARDSDDGPTADLLGELRDGVGDAIREVRRIVDGLAPSVVEDLGLEAALRLLVDDLGRGVSDGGPSISIRTEGAGEVAVPVAVAAYRITSEALSNAVRHARASRCDVSVTVDTAVAIVVTDDGVGFEPDVPHGGAGVRSLRERAAALGGTASVTSAPGKGTTVSVTLPLVTVEQGAQ